MKIIIVLEPGETVAGFQRLNPHYIEDFASLVIESDGIIQKDRDGDAPQFLSAVLLNVLNKLTQKTTRD